MMLNDTASQTADSSATTLRERVVSGVLWLTATRAFGQGITWILTLIVVRLLSPEDYGLMGMAVLFTGILYLFNEIGLGAAIVQRSDLNAEQISDLRWVIVAINAALFALVLLLAPVVAVYFAEPQLTTIIRVLALSFLINGVGIPSASILQREMAFKQKAAAEVAGNVAGAVTTLTLALLRYGVWSLVIGSLVQRLVTTWLYCVYRRPTFTRSFSFRNVGLFMNFGFQVTAARFLWYLYSSADMAVIGRVLGSVPLGYYSLAVQYSSLPLEKFVTILNEIAFPSLSSVQHDVETLQRHFLKLVSVVALVTFPMFIGLALVADSAIPALLGTKWLPALLPLRLLCVVSCFRALEVINTPATYARGRPQVVLINTVIGAVVLPIAFYIGARNGGINGVALAWLVTRPFFFGFVTSRALRVLELETARYVRCLWHPIIGSLVMIAVVLGVGAAIDNTVGRLLVGCVMGCVAYIGYQVLFNTAELRDLLDLLNLSRLRPLLTARLWRSRLTMAMQRHVAAIAQPSPKPEERRILLAAYHFPPSAAVGGLRIRRFARYLPEFGWRPYVLTVDDADRPKAEGTDLMRMTGLESVSITRTRDRSWTSTVYRRVKRIAQRLRGHDQVAVESVPIARATGREPLVQRLRRYARSLFVCLPDEHKNWAIFAVLPALRLIRRHRIECILTSAPPFSVHFIGLAVKLCTRITWVADFRDPWVESLPHRPAILQSWLSKRIEQWMESRVMHHADKVLTTTDQMRASLVLRYPHLPAGKFACVTNATDISQFVAVDHTEKYERFTITYAGSLYFDRTPEPLFAAFSALVKSGAAHLDQFRIKFVGSCRYVGDVETLALARQYGVESAVETIERVPHGEAFEIMRRSHLLLVLAPANQRLILPAKIFDYLGSGSRLLALAEPGATPDLIRETGAGVSFSEADVAGLTTYLGELLATGGYKELRNDPQLFRRYDGRALTEQLVGELTDRPLQSGGVMVRA